MEPTDRSHPIAPITACQSERVGGYTSGWVGESERARERASERASEWKRVGVWQEIVCLSLSLSLMSVARDRLSVSLSLSLMSVARYRLQVRWGKEFGASVEMVCVDVDICRQTHSVERVCRHLHRPSPQIVSFCGNGLCRCRHIHSTEWVCQQMSTSTHTISTEWHNLWKWYV